jgi:hypothetical protein
MKTLHVTDIPLKPSSVALFFALAATVLAGCASQARLYDVDHGGVIQATYQRGLQSGPITIHAPEGECSGEFSTVVNGSWGQIYAAGVGAPASTTQGLALSLANRGAAVATCPGGRVFECEYVASMGRGNGYCRDNRGDRYRLMF